MRQLSSVSPVSRVARVLALVTTLVGVAAVVGGCATSELVVDGGDPDVSPGAPPPVVRVGQPRCPPSLCTSANVGGHEIFELHENGLANGDGVVVDGLWKDHLRYAPNVIGDRLYGTRTGSPKLAGAALVGAFFRLQTPSGVFRVFITEVKKTVTFWLGAPTPIETYRLEYTGPGVVAPAPVCTPLADLNVGDGNTWVEPSHSILFAGDRYSPPYQITAWSDALAGDWFNVGCAGWWGSKLHLNRHTTAGSDASHQTSREERQDLLSMYVGNYCGIGALFTLPNTPVTWASANGWRDLGAFSKHEAVWGGGRAVCLDEPRHSGIDPAVYANITAACALANIQLPSCADLAGYPEHWEGSGNVRSAIP